MSTSAIDALFDEAHDDPFETCGNCLRALDTPEADVVFIGRTLRQTARQVHERSMREGQFLAAVLRPRATDGDVVTYEVRP